MYTLGNIFSSLIEKVKLNQEKKPISFNRLKNKSKVKGYTNVKGGINCVNKGTNRDYETFDQ